VAFAILPRPAGRTEISAELEARLAAAVRNSEWPLYQLTWHDIKVGRWEPEDDEEGPPQRCLLATCSMEFPNADMRVISQRVASELQHELSADLLMVDVLAEAPCRIPMLPEALSTVLVQDLAADGAMAASLETLRTTGLVALRDGLGSASLLHQLRTMASARVAQADRALRSKGVEVGSQLFRFSEASARGAHRFDLLFDLGCDSSAPLLEAVRASCWAPLVQEVLGPAATVECSVVYSRPGAQAQEWHSDGPHVGKAADWDGEGESSPYALCVFVPLINLTDEVGYTQFWLGSHRYKDLIGFGGMAPVLNSTTNCTVDAGGAVVYDYRLMHRGMPNRSTDTERPVLQFLYHHPDYTEKENYGAETLFEDPLLCKTKSILDIQVAHSATTQERKCTAPEGCSSQN